MAFISQVILPKICDEVSERTGLAKQSIKTTLTEYSNILSSTVGFQVQRQHLDYLIHGYIKTGNSSFYSLSNLFLRLRPTYLGMSMSCSTVFNAVYFVFHISSTVSTCWAIDLFGKQGRVLYCMHDMHGFELQIRKSHQSGEQRE